jgi:hypothetical protein
VLHEKLKRRLCNKLSRMRILWQGEEKIMLGTILIVLLILALIGVLPTWPHSRSWGYYPSGGIGVVLLILVVLVLLGQI